MDELEATIRAWAWTEALKWDYGDRQNKFQAVLVTADRLAAWRMSGVLPQFPEVEKPDEAEAVAQPQEP